MPTRLSLRLAELLITAMLAIAVFAAWRADRRDRAQLAADLAVAKQSLEQADARQHDRDAQLLQTLASLAAEKRNISKPAQIIHDLPNQIALPLPITLQSPNSTTAPGKVICSLGLPWSGKGPVCGPEGLDSAQLSRSGAKPNPTDAVIPAEDLKPLYDFTLDCKACQAKLASAQGDLADERTKTSVLTRERDEAVHAAKGGSVFRRITRAAKWLAIGAAAGAIATQTRR